MTDITTERRGDVTIVRLDRPKQLNALTAPMVAELHEVLEAVDADRTCRVVILTGEGRGFCAGADLGTMSGDEVRVDKDPVAVLYGQKRFSALSARLRSLHQPVIAAVNGAAVGAGLAMVLACDVRLAVVAGAVLLGVRQDGPVRRRHGRQLAAAARRRRRGGAPHDAHRPASSTPPRRCASASCWRSSRARRCSTGPSSTRR